MLLDDRTVSRPPFGQSWHLAVIKGFATAMIVAMAAAAAALICCAVVVGIAANALWRVMRGKDTTHRRRGATHRARNCCDRHVADLDALLRRGVGGVLAGCTATRMHAAVTGGGVNPEALGRPDLPMEAARPVSAPEGPRRLSPNSKGWDARQRGASIADCPFRENSRRGRAWLRGYGGFIA